MNIVFKSVRKTIDQNRVDEIFRSCKNPNNCYEYIALLFAEIDLDIVKDSPLIKINGFPKAGRQLGEYIFKWAMKKDRELGTMAIAGGGWMNWGWSTTDEIGDWEVSTEGLTITVRDENGEEKEVAL
jgi:hypothetical protein